MLHHKRFLRDAAFLLSVKLTVDFSAKGRECQLRQLEALNSEGNACNGNAPEYSHNRKEYRKNKTAENKPYGVCYGVGNVIYSDRFAEGHKAKAGEFEALLTKGSAYYRNAAQSAANAPNHSALSACQNTP